MKKILMAILAVMITMNSSVFVMADGETPVGFWRDNFENYKIGEKPFAYNDFYNSSAQKRADDWTSVSDGITVQKESAELSNKVAQMRNNTGSAVSMALNKYTEVDAMSNPNFEIAFRVKPNNNNIAVKLVQYGGEGGSSNILRIAGSSLYTDSLFLDEVESDKWHSVRINIILARLEAEIYFDNELVYYGEHGRADAGGYIVSFASDVAGGSSVLWDDFSFTEITLSDDGDEIPDNLDEYRNVHPRLFYTAEEFENMKLKIKNDFADDFELYIKQADEYVASGPREYFVDSNPEENWMRNEADKLRFLSFMYKITGDIRYKESATEYVEMAIKYPSWGRGSTFGNRNLPCAKMLISISCYYDWLYDELTADERYAVVSVFAERASVISDGKCWWRKSYMMNHCMDGSSGSMTAAMAIYDVYPEALNWAKTAQKSYKSIFKFLNGDGACIEGFMYWVGCGRPIEEYLYLSEKFYNTDYSDHGFVQNSSKYSSCIMNPDENTVVRFADYNNTFNVGNLALIASFNNRCKDEYQKKITQWFLNKYYNMFSPKDRISELLIRDYDKNAEALSPDSNNYPTETYFDELGIFASRTSWEDPDQTYVIYRCGPTLGQNCFNVVGYDPGTSHVHNDVNSPQIYTRGENLLDENTYGGFATASHNTLLVNGYGQWGDTGGFDISKPLGFKANPKITKIETSDNIVYSVADATESYSFELTGLKKFVRHFIYVKPDMLIMVDDIETEKRENPIPLEIRFFPMSQSVVLGIDGSYKFKGTNCDYEINPLILNEAAKSEYAVIPKEITAGQIGNKGVVRVTSEAESLVQPTVISWNDSGKTPEKVTGSEENGKYYFYTNSKIITLDIQNMEVSQSDILQKTKIKTDGVLIDNKTEAEIKDDRMYVALSDINSISRGQIKGEYSEENGEIILLDSRNKMSMKLGDSVCVRNGKSEELMGIPYKNGEEIMIPIRSSVMGFRIDCAWDESISTLKLTSNVDFSNAKIKTISAGGSLVKVEDGVFDYEMKVFESQTKLTVIPELEASKYDVKYPDGGYGKVVINIVSPNGQKNNTYNINLVPYYGIGNTAVYEMGYSSCDGNLGENVIDGDFGTRWSASGDGQYLWYDLGEPKEIEAMLVAFSSGNSRIGYFDIQVSDDKVNWTTVKECASSGKTKDAESYALDGVKARYIRFYGHGAELYGSGWNSVSELGIMSRQ